MRVSYINQAAETFTMVSSYVYLRFTVTDEMWGVVISIDGGYVNADASKSGTFNQSDRV